jgi:hypothetical protein
MLRWLTIALLTVSSLYAQTRGGAAPNFAISFGSGSFDSHRGGGFAGHGGPGHGLQQSPIFLGSPYFYPDSLYAPAAPQPVNSPVILLQAAPVPEPAKQQPQPQPVMIELQGGRYVRLGAARNPNQTEVARDFSVPTDARESQPAEVADRTLPPAVLVFRDGHQEQVRDYTIADGILYARGDYWTDGYWNKKIPLASLNLPASLQASQKSGVKFVLPASPNEVITRP